MLSPPITHKRELPILLWGFVISFLGSLPPGTTNVLTVQLAAFKGYETAAWFSLGCMVAEVICVSVCILVMDKMTKSNALINILEWATVALLIWIAVSSFAQVKNPTPNDVSLIPGNVSPFMFGLFLMIINPVQMPFWFGWTMILIERKILPISNRYNIQYIIGIAIGSIAASAIFIAGGQAITRWVSGKELLIQWIFGLTFLLIALIQIWKIIKRRRGLSQDQ